MGLLVRKARRDLRRHRGPFFALTLMIALGVAALTSIYGSYANLDDAIDRVYEEQRFHDLRMGFTPRTEDALAGFSGLPGVDDWEARFVADIPASFGGDRTPVMAHAIGIPDDGLPRIDALAFREGRPPTATASELLVESGFAAHHEVGIGEEVVLIGAGGPVRFSVVGVVTSPEYLWPAKTAVEHMPDVLRRWGVLYVPTSALWSLAGLEGTVNEAVLDLEEGADPLDVYGDASNLLDAASVTQVETRSTQASELIIGLLVGSLSRLALILPLLFLTVVGLSAYVLLTRFVTAQRANIGLLRALGYPPRTILWHYLTYAPILAVAGSLVGFLLGYALSFYVTRVFMTSVSLDDVEVRVRPVLLLSGLGMSLVFTVLAAFFPARRAARLLPAEAMRPPVPRWARRRWVEALLWPTRWLPPGGRMIVRNTSRNPRRALFTLLGLALAVSVVLAPLALLDSLNTITERSVTEVQRYDELVVLRGPVPLADLSGLEREGGILAAQPVVQLQRSLVREDEILDVTILGLPPESDLLQLRNVHEERLRVREGGVVLSRVFEPHGYRVGDTMTILGSELRIDGFARSAGVVAFVTLSQAQEWSGIENAATALMVDYEAGVDRDAARATVAAQVPVAASQSVEQAAADARAMLRLFYGFIGLVIAFGLVIGFAIVYNTVSINVLEESRDFSTMRTFGTPMGRVAALIASETLLLAVPGILLGLVLGNALARYLVSVYSSDLFVLELAVDRATFAFAAVAGLVAACLSQVPSVRSVARADLAKSARERST